MILCSIAGFLGSGKTTLVIDLSRRLAGEGRKVAIIVNEIGEVGVDGALMSAYGLQMKEITEGCICCALSNTLMNTLQQLAKEYDPDVVFIEPTGVALPSKINKVVRTSLVDFDKKFSVCLVDAYRAPRINREAGAFFATQIKGSNLIVISKIELVDSMELVSVIDMVRSINPKAKIHTLSARNNLGVDALKNIILGESVEGG